ncbi:MAG TPA: outer membrane beta-barrel protein [Pseudolabrys sp.]|nr:outer membrane beta-barrel protein [Pseudolabrys sp.]
MQAGYNWQLDKTWIVGLEGDIQVTGERANDDGSVATLIPFSTDFHFILTQTASNQWKFPWFGTFRGRLGGLVDPTLLLYATGGLAVGEFELSAQTTSTLQRYLGTSSTTPSGAPVITTAAFDESITRVGWTVGAGVEKKLDRHWSAKFEYLYLDFGTHTFLSGTGWDTSTRLRDHIVRFGLNYALN